MNCQETKQLVGPNLDMKALVVKVDNMIEHFGDFQQRDGTLKKNSNGNARNKKQ